MPAFGQSASVLWRRLLAAVSAAIVGASALLVAYAPPADAYSKISIYVYDKRAPASSKVHLSVDTLGAGQGASFTLQVREQGRWRTLAKKRANQYASYDTFDYLAPVEAQTVTFRATLFVKGRRAATSKLVPVQISAPSASPGATPVPLPSSSAAPVILRAEIPGQAGEWLAIDNYKFRFGPTISGDAAWRTVGNETLAKKPAAGYSTVLASVDYQMSSPPTPGVGNDVKFEYVGGDGVVYGRGDELSPAGRCTYTLASDLWTGNEKYDKTGLVPGGYRRLYACAIVKDAAITSGYWQVSEQYSSASAPRQYAQAAMASTLPFIEGHSPLAPFAQGDTFEVPFVFGQYAIRFQQTWAGSEAWHAFSSYSSTYKPPPAGWSIVFGKAAIRNTSAQDAAPFLEILDPDYIGGDGNVYTGYDELAPGGSCSRRIVLPADRAPGFRAPSSSDLSPLAARWNSPRATWCRIQQ